MTKENLKGKSAVVKNLRRKSVFRYALIGQGIIIGVTTGLIIALFRWLLIFADGCRNRLVAYANTGVGPALIAALVMLLLVRVIGWILRKEPESTGSGIPQVEAELLGKKDMNWLSVMVSKILGCALSIGGGLALGREGPSIQIGAMVGKGFARTNKRVLTEERYLMSCGAGAGLSAAFGAPLAGTIFCLEELYRNFSSEVLLSTMAAAASSDFVAAYIIGMEPVFGFRIEYRLPLKYYWFAMILGVVLGLFGSLYNRTIDRMQDFFDRVGTAANALAKKWSGRRRLNPKTGKMDYKGNIAPFAKRPDHGLHLLLCIPDYFGKRKRIGEPDCRGRLRAESVADSFGSEIPILHCQLRNHRTGRHLPAPAGAGRRHRRSLLPVAGKPAGH